jgi:hypothetical protein
MAHKSDINQNDMIDSESKVSASAASDLRLKEGLSAFMDGESDELEFRRLLGELSDNPELADCWRRYHVVRDTLNGEIHSRPSVNLLSSIHARLEAETVPAPAAAENSYMGRLLRFAGQGVIAASVAAMVLTGFTYLELANNQQEDASMVARQDSIPELGGDYTPSEFSRVVRMNDAARSRLQQAVYQFSTSPGSTTSRTPDTSMFLETLEPFEPLQAPQLPENKATEQQ